MSEELRVVDPIEQALLEDFDAWASEVDMAGPFCALEKLQQLLDTAPIDFNKWEGGMVYAARLYGFMEGLQRGRQIHEEEDGPCGA